MKETMTIHKALSELKVLDSRIERAIDEITAVTASKHNNAKISGMTVAEWCDEAKAKYQSAITLINRRNAIKRAITRSNAVTMVSINGVEYSVAEAIDMKAKGVEYQAKLTAVLKSQLAKYKRAADMENERLEARADEYLKSMYAGSDLKNMSDEIKKVRETFITAQTMELVDPLHAGETADKLQNDIDAFMSEVDSALSVSNALTTVDVEYETL